MQWVIGIYSLALVVNHDDNWLQLKIAITQPGELQQMLSRYIPQNPGPKIIEYSSYGPKSLESTDYPGKDQLDHESSGEVGQLHRNKMSSVLMAGMS